MTSAANIRAVVLVEGTSDRTALLTLADRAGRDLSADGVEVVDMGGITNIRAFASHYGPGGLDLSLVGLYDTAQEEQLRRGLAAAGFETARLPDGPTRLGFHGCHADLEDELIRALGPDRVEAVIEAAGEGPSLRRLRGMPAQRDRPRVAVLRRFFGSRAGRKERYAALLVHALEPDRVPAPLVAVLGQV
ncbi:TOPRIM nucleotidyl transferase/hydrolase domain-containing protein [Nakamurella sp.]|uniref:TOPRIM nucleotidyl transferase/hydrolase domain-containing protein n=1 Tax=Nakamurella sp. TaxID=1869182 RepID=UPI0037838679